MKIKFLFLAVGFFACAAFAQEITTSPGTAADIFESPGEVEAKRFLAPDLLKGPLHAVGRRAENDGLNNVYFLSCAGNDSEVSTGLALRTRIREIYAIARLRELSKSKEFAKAMRDATKQKIEGAAGVVKDPVGTVKRLPAGASRFFGRIGEGMKGGKSESEGGSPLQDISGLAKAKMALAVQYGVSPYSFNEELQKQLTENARAMAGGGLVVRGALGVVGGPAGAVITGLNVNQTLQQTLVNSTPDDLRVLNRKKLLAMGVSRDDADEILMHRWFSPWSETIMIDSLAKIGVDPTAFLGLACKAQGEEDAIYFVRLAQVLARYHSNKAPIREISVEKGAICGFDANGTLVVPLSCDYAIWSEHSAGRVDDLILAGKNRSDTKGLAIWVDGKISDRAEQEVKARNISVSTGVLDT